MSTETEIEKKYKVLSLPNGFPNFPHKEIEQSYLNKGGEPIRLRRFEQNGEVTCLLSKKVRESDIRCTEYNIPLPREVYVALKEAKEGRTIRKTRYIIPLDGGMRRLSFRRLKRPRAIKSPIGWERFSQAPACCLITIWR